MAEMVVAHGEDALAAFARGEFLVVMDDEGRENEGDLICSAALCTTEKMAFLIKHSSGFVCISLPPARLEALEVPMMLPTNTDRHRTAYTVTVDYKHGTTTGISAHDRALTARKLASSDSSPDDFSRPGHLVPLRAREGGVLTRRGHTEAALGQWLIHFTRPIDLLIFLLHIRSMPSGLLCELVNDDAQGTMARRDDCRAFAQRWGLKMISIEMLAQYRTQLEAVERERRALP
ncbi:3,4-dihydroxy-2-butanone 4-phosphate synthase [Sistotremastrum suecicum HHB10207 ss-3]|uniref:3,4-dihydroxy-2-butanone 4-phosphate synthase n=1 Tax=Sistotremastrum suecicum HHB10207 ss-3 TaxID=1314776 RepID=A0A166HZS3_9AGAM|nr:3,4-dihydroxy-2-butanone 4-phosphate synthase [Sistotremastrum suecicum HHB10207 ss-3]